jgi:hypothetical protein
VLTALDARERLLEHPMPPLLRLTPARLRRVVSLGLALGALPACSPVHMAVPPEVAALGPALEAQDRSLATGLLADEGFRLGPYVVKDVDRDWDHTDESSAGSVTTTASRGGYRYRFDALEGRCRARSGRTDADLGAGFSLSADGHARLQCDCGGAGFDLAGDVDTFGGTLTLEDERYTLRGIRELDGGGERNRPTGYRVDGDAPLGAVEVEHPGRVWLREELDEEQRARLSCLLVGLMLYQPPELR